MLKNELTINKSVYFGILSIMCSKISGEGVLPVCSLDIAPLWLGRVFTGDFWFAFHLNHVWFGNMHPGTVHASCDPSTRPLASICPFDDSRPTQGCSYGGMGELPPIHWGKLGNVLENWKSWEIFHTVYYILVLLEMLVVFIKMWYIAQQGVLRSGFHPLFPSLT